MGERKDIDILLRMIENPVRRKILYKISREAHYPLQLSRELKISQQSVTKHLKALKDAGFVETFEGKSEAGPPRIYYTIPNKQFSVLVDIGPGLFNVKLQTSGELSDKAGLAFKGIEDKCNHLLKLKGSLNRLKDLSKLLGDVNRSISELEERRLYLSQIKQKILEETYGIIGKLDDYQQRSVLYYIVGEDAISIRQLSEEVDLREEVVEKILNRLSEKDII